MAKSQHKYVLRFILSVSKYRGATNPVKVVYINVSLVFTGFPCFFSPCLRFIELVHSTLTQNSRQFPFNIKILRFKFVRCTINRLIFSSSNISAPAPNEEGMPTYRTAGVAASATAASDTTEAVPDTTVTEPRTLRT